MYHMTEVFVTGGVDYIPNHIFHFTDLSEIINAALEDTFLIGELFLFIKIIQQY